MDSRLPGGALPLGALHEIAGGGNDAIDGAAAALFAAGIAARTRGKVLWCLTRLDLFAPALAHAGLKSDRVIYLEGGNEKTILACFEEGLRHGGRSVRITWSVGISRIIRIPIGSAITQARTQIDSATVKSAIAAVRALTLRPICVPIYVVDEKMVAKA